MGFGIHQPYRIAYGGDSIVRTDKVLKVPNAAREESEGKRAEDVVLCLQLTKLNCSETRQSQRFAFLQYLVPENVKAGHCTTKP